jgi:hypothetical protein
VKDLCELIGFDFFMAEREGWFLTRFASSKILRTACGS